MAPARTIALSGGVFLIAAAAAWHFAIADRWTQRIPPGWSWSAHFTSESISADPQTGTFPSEMAVSLANRSIGISSEERRPASVAVTESYVLTDPATDELVWRYDTTAEVDPMTGRRIEPEFAQDYALFPRNVEKRTYNLRSNYLEGVPLAFEREEEVAGLATYLFSYRGRGEYTESYAGTADYPGVAVEPTQEIACADDQFVYRAWVEPLTGEVVKVEDSCRSGDWIFDIATRTPVAPLMRWANETLGDDVIRRADVIREERLKLLLVSRIVPLALLLAGIAGIAWALAGRKARSP